MQLLPNTFTQLKDTLGICDSFQLTPTFSKKSPELSPNVRHIGLHKELLFVQPSHSLIQVILTMSIPANHSKLAESIRPAKQYFPLTTSPPPDTEEGRSADRSRPRNVHSTIGNCGLLPDLPELRPQVYGSHTCGSLSEPKHDGDRNCPDC